MNRMLIAAAIIMLVGAPALAQTYGPGGVGPRYQNQYNGPGWLDGRPQGRSVDAYAQNPSGRRDNRRSLEGQGNFVGPNPVLPGRW